MTDGTPLHEYHGLCSRLHTNNHHSRHAQLQHPTTPTRPRKTPHKHATSRRHSYVLYKLYTRVDTRMHLMLHHLISSRLVFAKTGTCSHWMWRTCQDHDQPKHGPIFFPRIECASPTMSMSDSVGPRAHLYEALTKVTHVDYLFSSYILINRGVMPSTPFPVEPGGAHLLTTSLSYISQLC